MRLGQIRGGHMRPLKSGDMLWQEELLHAVQLCSCLVCFFFLSFDSWDLKCLVYESKQVGKRGLFFPLCNITVPVLPKKIQRQLCDFSLFGVWLLLTNWGFFALLSTAPAVSRNMTRKWRGRLEGIRNTLVQWRVAMLFCKPIKKTSCARLNFLACTVISAVAIRGGASFFLSHIKQRFFPGTYTQSHLAN